MAAAAEVLLGHWLGDGLALLDASFELLLCLLALLSYLLTRYGFLFSLRVCRAFITLGESFLDFCHLVLSLDQRDALSGRGKGRSQLRDVHLLPTKLLLLTSARQQFVKDMVFTFHPLPLICVDLVQF